MSKYCRYCGEPVEASAKFCGKCGEPVAVNSDHSGINKLIKIGTLALVVVLIIVLFSKCVGGSVEDMLVGSWYTSEYDSLAFVLYDDGTCKLDGEYGTGKWAVVNDNKLKLSNFYGETVTPEIVDISNNELVLNYGSSTRTFVKGD